MAERRPLTLTEKHADLLQFIAQKESKCLELRSQLMAHEEELGQLKRKWERIVSRGMDRAYTPAFPSHNMPLSSTPSSSRHATSPSLASTLLNPSNGAVLDGIKEGVQGVGRLLAAGLELSSSSSPSATATSPGLSSVSRAAMTPALKRAKHVNTQSVSSVSTSGTASSSVLSAGTRLSQSSASSLSFPEDEEDRALLEEDEDSTIHRRSMHEALEQTMSSEFTPPTTDKSAKLIRRRSREAPKLPSPSFFDGHSPVSPNASLAGAPVSSWVGSMGSTMGKKWEEIQKGETFTKSQKRASLLISDVSQSFFAALASPVPSQPSHPTRSLAASPLSISTNANPFLATTTLFASASPSASPVPSSGSLLEDDEIGDLDMTNGKGLGEVLIPVSLSPNLSTLSGGKKPEETKVQPAPTPSLDDDDDWNW
ncbi:hypothetical protein EUX98_g4948 [Antrodiella citrinella]|uniref:DUF4048 domain-containing protein n=1 Tax=Antrodiella citrinella TaxID=2447956 RepID=A0A4S4MSV1_9APHY|nr:hypothetical protein EUX98_g4948 [Antrodiella citrinella]